MNCRSRTRMIDRANFKLFSIVVLDWLDRLAFLSKGIIIPYKGFLWITSLSSETGAAKTGKASIPSVDSIRGRVKWWASSDSPTFIFPSRFYWEASLDFCFVTVAGGRFSDRYPFFLLLVWQVTLASRSLTALFFRLFLFLHFKWVFCRAISLSSNDLFHWNHLYLFWFDQHKKGKVSHNKRINVLKAYKIPWEMKPAQLGSPIWN